VLRDVLFALFQFILIQTDLLDSRMHSFVLGSHDTGSDVSLLEVLHSLLLHFLKKELMGFTQT